MVVIEHVQQEDERQRHDQKVLEHVQGVAMYTSAGLMTTALASGTILSLLPPPTMSNISVLLYEWKSLSSLLGVSSIMALVGTLGVSFTSPTITMETDQTTSEQYPVETNSNWRHFFAGSLFVSSGVLLSPLLYYATGVNPYIVPTALLTTGASTLGMLTFAMTAKPSRLLALRAPLHIMLWGLLGVGIFQYVYPESTALNVINSLGCVGVFSAYTAYDLYKTIREYESGQPDTINSAVSFHLNIVNVFSSIVRLLTNTTSTKKRKK